MDVWTRLEQRLPAVVDHPQAVAAVLVPLYEDAAGVMRVVLTRRPDEMPTHPGDIVFPGGYLVRGEHPIDTAKREAREEVGIPEQAVTVLGGLETQAPRDGETVIVPVVSRIERPAELRPDPVEVAAILEPRIDDLLDEDRWVQQDFLGHELWFFEFPEGILWGATGFMMRELLGYLR